MEPVIDILPDQIDCLELFGAGQQPGAQSRGADSIGFMDKRLLASIVSLD